MQIQVTIRNDNISTGADSLTAADFTGQVENFRKEIADVFVGQDGTASSSTRVTALTVT